MQPDSAIGIMAAIPQELAALEPHLEASRSAMLAGTRFVTGTMDGIPVVAADCGIGKVNAALIATLLAEHYRCRALVFSGVAGSLDESVHVGDVVIARTVICHDYGALIEERIVPYQPGIAPLPGMSRDLGYALEETLLERIKARLDAVDFPLLPVEITGGQARRPGLHVGTVLTGDQFVNCSETRHRLRTAFDAIAVEMEGAAVAQVAQAFAIPAIIVRAMSDLAGVDSHVDFGTFLGIASAQAALAVRALVPALQDWQG